MEVSISHHLEHAALAAFWGKSAIRSLDGAVQDAPAFKPVIHHMLDVAAAALVLQDCAQPRLQREADIFGVDAASLRDVRTVLVGLHDLGKFSRAFQAKAPDLWPAEVLGPWRGEADPGHWRLTASILSQERFLPHLRRLFPNLPDAALTEIIGAVAGHHGRPPRAEDFERLDRTARRSIGEAAFDAAEAAITALTKLVKPPPIAGPATCEWARRFSWSLSGLTTLADWVGSGAAFEFRPIETPLDIYWAETRATAERSVRANGLAPAPVAAEVGLAAVFPEASRSPRPMQVSADDAELSEGPVLFVIEDATGSGKTEAALALASRLMAAGRAEGIYIALPTMATANAMFARLRDAHLRLFAPGARPSIVLAHGRSGLSPLFAEIRQSGRRRTAEDETVEAACAEWIADDRRKAFFAEMGAGTVDQAFLSVLPKKFLTLRQYGLAGRVLIVDEAHAFDAYMSEELATLLRIQAAAGGSAIVLSATLPQAKLAEIAAAFAKGLGAPAPTLGCKCYPLMTTVSATGTKEMPADPFSGSVRRVAVERLGDPEAAMAAAREAAAQGAAVLWVRNAVDEAIRVAETLRASGAVVDLFHARFATTDRLAIETEVLGRFGRDAAPKQRAGRILVATQVVEQSLDLDFDLVISDLAPVDLLIQRAGRLWRHMDRRPREFRPVEGPRLLVVSPDPMGVTGPDWLEPALGKGRWVYRHAGVMWRSALAIFEAGVIDAPHGLRPLIERVYAEDDVPDALAAAQREAEGIGSGQRTLGRLNVICVEYGYGGVGEVSPDQEIGTRLGEPTRTLRLSRLQDGVVRPWAVEDDPRRAWALSEASVPERWVRELAPPEALAPAIEIARAGWPEWDRSVIAVVDVDGVLALHAPSSERPLVYSLGRGLSREVPRSRG